jgi:hypothetical protein
MSSGWRLHWQDMRGHLLGYDLPEPSFKDFETKEEADAAKRLLLPDCISCVTPIPAPRRRVTRKGKKAVQPPFANPFGSAGTARFR